MKGFLFLVVLVLALLSGCVQTEDGFIMRTADPEVGIRFVFPMAEVGLPLPVPEPLPPCEIVKGNISRSGEKIYHIEGQANYDNVKINEAAGEAFFCSAEEAEAAGFRASLR